MGQLYIVRRIEERGVGWGTRTRTLAQDVVVAAAAAAAAAEVMMAR